VVTPFTVRFSTNDTGDIAIVGNTLMTCPASAASCISAQTGIAAGATANDNTYNMVYVDVDNNPTTFNSSRTNLSLPSGATVLWAGLYWGGDTTAGQDGNPAPNPSLRNRVRFETPATGGYVDLAGTVIGASTYNGDDYQAFFDVTAMVQAGGSGTYRVANVQAGTGRDHNAGWGLVVVYRDASQPTRNLTVFDGFATVTTGSPNVTVDVSGFLAPFSGPVYTRIGVVVYEGDVGLVGDRMRLEGLDLSDILNPDSNFFNSSITQLGARVTATRSLPGECDRSRGVRAQAKRADSKAAGSGNPASPTGDDHCRAG
jgi:hypothetical protein